MFMSIREASSAFEDLISRRIDQNHNWSREDWDASYAEEENIKSEFKEYLATISSELNENQREIVYETAEDMRAFTDSHKSELFFIGTMYEKMVTMMSDVASAETTQFDQ